ncbi:CAMK/CAMK1 protein kinase Cmk2 [Schizosaccharomyces japonicus yFS275]|uniref:CAMK/CAMK1 protein kinase Cmk2 n=1 Tax=Schizosaccharomyces japonicus (strain yFS275 / FY16936) TaxID=402676 RepID=B6JZ32_SCHJY|nr:CAMK/CAMK1 protein kinase Cmk2 [Schizosaccharomyces japonicus yFS275]EEB06800.1 CAMK/CAMK1 protein kinase Cmk2 [Schizosaccharomyces japonicus yFS275]
MSIIDGFKQLLKHSKSSKDRPKGGQESSSKTNSRAVYEEMAIRMVAAEAESRGKIPLYPGLEGFQLLEKLGDGAFSNVYKAICAKTQAKVAIKVIRKYEMTEAQRETVYKEVAIMKRVNHENIVSLQDFVETTDYYHLIMDLVEGGELFHQIVRLTFFSEDLARHIIVQVAEAIRHLHDECGIVHRDIKPENLLFDPIDYVPTENYQPPALEPSKVDEGVFRPGIGGGGIGRIRLADFGFSKVIWNSKTSTPCGTVGYAAPEIVKDELYSKNVDMWALGCVLHTMLCGFPPFFDEDIRVLATKVVNGEFTFLSPWWDDISETAKDLVSNLLTVDPMERYDIHQFLQHPWIKGESKMPQQMLAVPSEYSNFQSLRRRSVPSVQPIVIPNPINSSDELSPTNSERSCRFSRSFESRTPDLSTLHEAMGVAYDIRRMSHAEMSSPVPSISVQEGGDDTPRVTTPIPVRSLTAKFIEKAMLNSPPSTSFELDLTRSPLFGRRTKHTQAAAAAAVPQQTPETLC